MSTNENNRLQLIEKLKEMFQMDQADLDFGIYRIMNAKREEISRFLEQDLLPTLRTTLEELQPVGLAEKKKNLAEAIENARKLKIDPNSLEIVQQLKDELSQTTDIVRLENEVYSDLYTFFSRYYRDGDFLSLRRYKEGVYALPYEGEEVKLHWANADQYYIKTAENFTRYAFTTNKGRVRFELAEAYTEHGNIKAERRFLLSEAPLGLENGELLIHFEYRPDSKKRKQKELNTSAIDSLLALPAGVPLTENIPDWDSWRRALAEDASADKRGRSTIEKHLTDYTAKNTFDYFIHKDLGKFLRRELDFFIKNEVMRLDDIEEDSAPRVENYLSRIKAMRRIAHKIIGFLAQLENFQKKLWLKKKFILETNWLITLDRIDENFYSDICEQAEVSVRGWDGRTRNQREVWVELFAIDEIEEDLVNNATYSVPLTNGFLKANPFLTLDTAFLSQDLKERLIASIEDIDDQTNGLLVHGENFQALNLLQARYREKLSCIYIDPPYNTGGNDFIYKDAYQRSSWASLMVDRLKLGRALQTKNGTITVSIDDDEQHRLTELLNLVYGHNELAKLVWDRNRKNDARFFSVGHEYMLVWANSNKEALTASGIKFREPREGLDEAKKAFSKLCKENGVDWVAIRDGWKKWFDNIPLADPRRRLLRFSKVGPRGPFRDDGNLSWPGGDGPRYEIIHPITQKPCKLPSRGWIYPNPERFWEEQAAGKIQFGEDENRVPSGISYLFEGDEGQVMPSVFYSYAQTASQQFDAMFGYRAFDNPKHWPDLLRVIRYVTPTGGTVLDYFAGSGSTAHAIMDLQRLDDKKRDYILIEMGDHFDKVLRPRLQKAIYSSSWSEGKPVSREGISQIIKYVRLESYEDVSGNLSSLAPKADQAGLLDNPKNKSLKESYTLNYMLEVESRAQLLNLDKFIDPFNIETTIVRNDESRKVKVDIIETFNYLLGLRVKSVRRTKNVFEVIGSTPDNYQVLILWRNINTVDNDALDDWFHKQAYNSRDQEFDIIYVNGDNNIENLRRSDETWKVRLIEEVFYTLMFDEQDV
jgi:adenine-specific DNA-methyltransferase